MEDKKKDEEQVFAVGERTVMTMQSQSFLDEEFGTIAGDASDLAALDASMPAAPAENAPVREDGAPVSAATADDLIRIERKLDTLTHLLNALNRRLDSIDMVLARMISRQP
jgi:hypothetical protein